MRLTVSRHRPYDAATDWHSEEIHNRRVGWPSLGADCWWLRIGPIETALVDERMTEKQVGPPSLTKQRERA